jgi:glycosyltransferase involved in cell wall biosynthesis
MQKTVPIIVNPCKKKTRVLHLISSSGFYGAERVIYNLVRGMDPHEGTVYLATIDNQRHPNDDLARRLSESGFRVFRVPCRGRIDLATVGEVTRILRDNQIDILHCHEDKSIVYGIVAAKLRHVASVVTLHSWIFPSRLEKIYEPLIGVLIRFFDRIAVVSNEFEANLEKFRIRKRVVRFIPNGIDPPPAPLSQAEKRDVKKRLNTTAEELIIAMVGRLETGKGHREFLDAAALLLKRHRNLAFLVVGDGSLAPDLRRHAASLGLSGKVVFTGYVKEMNKLYAIIDICVLPSMKEGMPMVILEAMGHGISVVATRVGELKHIIRSKENGILLEQASAKSISAAVDELVRNPRLMKKIGSSAQQTVNSSFLSVTMARRYEQLYAQVIDSTRLREGFF